MANAHLTAEYVRELFHYDPETGVMKWISQSPKKRQCFGKQISHKCSSGYLQCKIDGRCYMVHRIAWLYVYGKWPSAWIDHINGIRTDNRIGNLRECTSSENQQNISSKNGRLGTRWNSLHKKWLAAIKINGKTTHLGVFTSQAKAHAAYLDAKAKAHLFQSVPRDYLGQESRNSLTSPAARSASDATSTSRLVHSLKTSESAAE